ncbi:FecCD family ABC transporter permease [Aliarcobacter cryaerophilus]|uniref:FecCD family ABC transporter permease n=1 Tax=Aliarcobacter cryaerophilus TaxID=28198 RepID=UPI0021B1B8AD|nr:iron ABC transporter permease [Aliarcobacter cryaerophilus]MCT7480391.1 iron ABC transporter permease [Aliarcobacter cryaerophilus]MCT7484729.1 iron ABC transporter permease [Aliarcobacter cryaerophilus]MCT7544393.1 iron ABC transporter permease [Aliarcobacter cryaerophilus]
MFNQKKTVILIFIALLIFSIIINITIGAFKISIEDILNTLSNQKENLIFYQVLVDIRLPRVFLAIFVGIAFGLSGALMQTLFKNPLADPSIIGVSAGASAGVVIFMMIGSFLPLTLSSGIFSYFSLPFSAFLGAVITIFLIYKLATIYNKVAVTIMLLAGIAINAMLGALVGLFTYVSTEEELKSFTFWTMGSLAHGDLKVILTMLPVVIVTFVFAMNKKTELNLMLLGEDEAKNSGVNSEKLKKLIIFFVSLAIGVSVAFCGIIGFVGLIVPHIARMLVGSNHKYYIPLSGVLGAFILLWADSFARTIVSPAELPIGIITALIGAPFFLWLLIRNRQSTIN